MSGRRQARDASISCTAIVLLAWSAVKRRITWGYIRQRLYGRSLPNDFESIWGAVSTRMCKTHLGAGQRFAMSAIHESVLSMSPCVH